MPGSIWELFADTAGDSISLELDCLKEILETSKRDQHQEDARLGSVRRLNSDISQLTFHTFINQRTELPKDSIGVS